MPSHQSLEGTWKTPEEADLSDPWCPFLPPFLLFPSTSKAALPPLTCHGPSFGLLCGPSYFLHGMDLCSGLLVGWVDPRGWGP